MSPGLLSDTVNPSPHTHIEDVKSVLTHIEDSSAVPQDFTAFQFHQAAAKQIEWIMMEGKQPNKSSSLLVTSPYNSQGHLLDLQTLPDIQDRILALALSYLTPVVEDYALADYSLVFNWDEVKRVIQNLSAIAGQEWIEKSYYVVIFRSKLKQDYDQELLWTLDRESHREAVESGGLLKYWFGKRNSEYRNLATCSYSIRIPIPANSHRRVA
jgi:hypothetical protein